MEANEKEYIIADEVWQRVIQIVQEAMLTGVDSADLLRQIRVQEGDNGLVLTIAYKKMIEEHYEKMVADADKIRSAKQAAKIIGSS